MLISAGLCVTAVKIGLNYFTDIIKWIFCKEQFSIFLLRNASIVDWFTHYVFKHLAITFLGLGLNPAYGNTLDVQGLF